MMRISRNPHKYQKPFIWRGQNNGALHIRWYEPKYIAASFKHQDAERFSYQEGSEYAGSTSAETAKYGIAGADSTRTVPNITDRRGNASSNAGKHTHHSVEKKEIDLFEEYGYTDERRA